MRTDLTDITLVVDRSGSMSQVKSDAEGGINEFILAQAQLPGEANITLVQFDTEYEFLYKGIPIKEAPSFELVPRGMTALLDAIGRAMHETDARISRMNQQDRPSLVVFVIMTDGYENASGEFSKDQIKRLIRQFQGEQDWKFTFLGADQDAFAEAHKIGIRSGATAAFSKSNVANAFRGTCSMVQRMRSQVKEGKRARTEFTDEERNSMK